ncbi:hypothetical protein BJV82DRAFT_666704 [Fennellomyces sp. T-0311]|nr:hypothetical protein BJV82DRAFT_666704 [Fennellomyces sp. T-0311]
MVITRRQRDSLQQDEQLTVNLAQSKNEAGSERAESSKNVVRGKNAALRKKVGPGKKEVQSKKAAASKQAQPSNGAEPTPIHQGKRKRKRDMFLPHWSSRPRNRFSMFIEFQKQYRKQITQENPGLSIQQVNSIVAQAYQNLAPEKKESLRRQCALLREKAKRPKLPPTGYVMFRVERLPGFREMYPSASFTDLNNMLGKLWRESDPEVRAQYTERSRVAREKFRAEHSGREKT